MKEFLLKMLSSGDDISSKRVIGIFLILIYFIIFVLAFFIEFKEVHIDMANNMLIVGASLLGLGLLDKFKTNNKQNG